jgi:antitoxin component YwqK of YwqJK toxin-antitoxin module
MILVDGFSTSQTGQSKISFDEEMIYSQDTDVPYTGKLLDTLDNKFIIEFNVVNGFKQGEFHLIKMDGTYAVQGHMNKNKNDGIWKYYYENGELECSGNFDDDKPSGKWTWFHRNGLVRCEGIFVNGKPEGQWIKYNQDGNPSVIVKYQFGEVINYVSLDTPVSS